MVSHGFHCPFARDAHGFAAAWHLRFRNLNVSFVVGPNAHLFARPSVLKQRLFCLLEATDAGGAFPRDEHTERY